MVDPKQLPLFTDTDTTDNDSPMQPLTHELGTFKDSMRAPIHGWFRYPAGYSYKLVEAIFARYSIAPGHWVYDPFSGTGTTLVCAKQMGIHAYGVEAHAFVHWVADVKLFWDFDHAQLQTDILALIGQCRSFVARHVDNVDITPEYPDLVYKCYHPNTLKQLTLIKHFIVNHVIDTRIFDLMKLALTDTLRSAAAAGTGWPYIAPNKNTGDKPPKNALEIFERTLWRQVADLRLVGSGQFASHINNVMGDSRQLQELDDGQIDLALTSPPYLNNYDYADRTRLETYFWGIAKSWKDITEHFRDRLMVAATTQVVRSKYTVESALSPAIQETSASTYSQLQHAIIKLSELRTTKGGKKDYDLMVALYFNDMLRVMREAYRVLKLNGHFCLVLGDSAPYGVHIPTEMIIGQLGLGLGFRSFDYEEFRRRGDKWKANPQRHTVNLREGMVILTK